jgi:phenylacetate-coenzyme A ligase PaaK-like adenylate-forming protein
MDSNYLDYWIWRYIKGDLARSGDLPHIAATGKQQLDRAVLEEYQMVKLRRTVAYVINKSPFYRDLFSKHGVPASLLRTPADLGRIPFTGPEDIIKDPYRFLCVPMGEISRIISLSTSGTTGERKRVFFTENDLRRIVDLLAANTKAVLGEKQGTVQIMLPGETMMGQADALAKGVEEAGATAVMTGSTSDVMKQIKAIAEHGTIALVGYSFYLHRLTKLAGERHQLSDMGIEAVVTTGEPVPAAVRKTLEDQWKARVFSHYGLTEMGFNAGMGCESGTGYHIHEGDYLVEVINPDTGQPVADGEEGEVVITSLEREGMPLIRYRTRDLGRVIARKCTCGSILKKIDMITKRTGTGIRLGPGELYPFTFDESLFSIPMVLDYQLAVKKERDRTILIFLVETMNRRQATGSAPKEIAKVIEQHPLIKEDVLGKKTIVEVEFVSKMSLRDTSSHKRLSAFVDPCDRRPV